MDIESIYQANEDLYNRVKYIIELFNKHNRVPFFGLFVSGQFDLIYPIIKNEIRYDFNIKGLYVHTTLSTNMNAAYPPPPKQYELVFKFPEALISSYTDAQLIEWYEDYCDKRNEEYYRTYCANFIKTVTDNPELANKVLTLSKEELKIYINEYIGTLKKQPFDV